VKNIGRFILTIIGAYLIGAVAFYASSTLVYVLTRFGNWTLSLPVWGVSIIFIVIGYIVIELYKKIPLSKE